MSILRKLLNLFQKDDLYVPWHEDPYLKRGMQNRIYLNPETKLGSLLTVKRQLSKANRDKEKENTE